MMRGSYRPEKMINKLRTAKVRLSQGTTAHEVTGETEANEQTYCLWGRHYSGMRIEQVKSLKELELARLIF